MSIMEIVEQIMLKVMTFVIGIGVIFDIVKQTFRHGYSAVWVKETFAKPAVLSDPSYGTHGFLKVNDVSIHYVASGPEDKPLMLLVHGFPEFWFSWRHQIKEFQKDYRVVAIDMRGYGESSKPEGVESYVMSKLMNDIKQVILALGHQSCVLVAHDWGGVVCWAFGRHFPDMVDKLIIMNAPAAPSFEKLVRTHKEQKKMSWYILFFQIPYLPELRLGLQKLRFFDGMLKDYSTQEEIDAYKYTYSQTGAFTPPINYYRAALGMPKSSVKYDMDYIMPVLLVWGEKDTALHIDNVTQIQKDCPKLEVRRIPEAAHFVQMDKPDQVNKAMREWLEAVN